MKKIAILGCENSHADAFLTFIKEKEEFSDVEVVGVYSDDTAAAQKLNEKFGAPVMNDYTDAVGKVDGIMVTARHGDNHFKYAKPYIESGIPMFIDKPITVSESDALEFMAQLKKNNVCVTGGSSLKHDDVIKQLKKNAEDEVNGKTIGGYVRAPYQAQNDYGGFFFYAPHLIEMVCQIFGNHPLSVTAKQNGKQVHVLFHYENYDCVGLFCDSNYFYYASRMAEKGADSSVVTFTKDWYYREFALFYDLLSGNTAAGEDYNEFIAPVFVMNAVNRAIESGNTEIVGVPEV